MLAGCALDVETTGLDHREDAVIELAVRRFWADADGAVVVAGRPHRWLEDPLRPIAPEIARLTGLSDADVAGRSILDAEAATLIADADFVVAHNAAFDRPFVERRLPGAAGGRWVCSMADVDWRGLGFEGRSLSHLLLQAGWFYEAHRASVDVDALITLLGHPLPGGGTVLLRALDRATRQTWMVEAVRAPFERSPLLRARGYRWEPFSRCWRREIEDDALDDEIGWATSEIYCGSGPTAVPADDVAAAIRCPGLSFALGGDVARPPTADPDRTGRGGGTRPRATDGSFYCGTRTGSSTRSWVQVSVLPRSS